MEQEKLAYMNRAAGNSLYGVPRNWALGIGMLLALQWIYRLYLNLEWFPRYDLDSFNLTEFLINYHGGFVRRGLAGELLWNVSHATGWDTKYVAWGISLVVFAIVAVWMVCLFRRARWCWWLLCSPLLLGYLDDIMRKDFLMILLALSALALGRHGGWRGFAGAIVAAAGVLVHESFLFFGVPLFALALPWRQSRLIASICILLPLFAAAACAVWKGDAVVANAIGASWDGIGGMTGNIYRPGFNALGALDWDGLQMVRGHWWRNFSNGMNGRGILPQAVIAVAGYYLAVNFLMVFQNKSRLNYGKPEEKAESNPGAFTETDRRNIGSVLLLTWLCCLPLFLGLSCDYNRVAQYVGLSSFGAVLVLGRDETSRRIPQWLGAFVGRLTAISGKLMPPARGWLMALLLVWCTTETQWNVTELFDNSIFGTLSRMAGNLAGYLFEMDVNPVRIEELGYQ